MSSEKIRRICKPMNNVLRALILVAANQLRRYGPFAYRALVKVYSTNPMVLVWGANLWFFEIALIYFYTAICYFPKISKTQQKNGIIIADPQLTDAYSYKQEVKYLTDFLTGPGAETYRVLF